MEEDERRLSFPPPAPLHSPGEEIDGSRLLGEIVRTLEATNPEVAAPLVASQSRDALDAAGAGVDGGASGTATGAGEGDRPRRDDLRIPLEGVTFASDASGGGVGGSGRDEPRAAVTPFTRESARRAGSRGAQLVREFGFMPRRRLSVEDGARLPRKYEPFPPKLYGRPLEEIDNFIYDEVSPFWQLVDQNFPCSLAVKNIFMFIKLQRKTDLLNVHSVVAINHVYVFFK